MRIITQGKRTSALSNRAVAVRLAGALPLIRGRAAATPPKRLLYANIFTAAEQAIYMILLDRILKPENVLCGVSARGKKHCLEILSELLASASPGTPHEEIFAKLAERERLGSTALGNGVALPHCRFTGVAETSGVLLKLSDAVDFESSDDEPVDLVFGMMVPEEITETHHREIATVADALKDPSVQERLRSAGSPGELYRRFVSANAIPDVAGDRRQQSQSP